MYVQASDTKTAEQTLTEGMKGTMGDYGIESIAETKIVDVYKYDLKEGAQSLNDKKDN